MSTSSARLARLAKQSCLISTSVATGTLAMAQTAQADLVIMNINQTATFENPVGFDVNDDGRMDFTFFIGQRVDEKVDDRFIGGGEIGFVSTRSLKMKPIEGDKIVNQVMALEEPTTKLGKRGIFAGEKGGDFAPFATRFEEGDVINDLSGDTASKARLYEVPGHSIPNLVAAADDDLADVARGLDIIDDGAFGPFADVGDSGYIGFFFDLLPRKGDDIDFRALQTDVIGDDVAFGSQRFYGWAEIARGSVDVIRVGIQTQAFAGAPIPGGTIDVPEPATLPLMALGAAGLAALRRRKAA